MRSHLAVVFIVLLTGAPAMGQDLPKHTSAPGCPATFAPVCAKKHGDAMGYLNACLARADGAANVKLGNCSPGD